MYEALFWSVMPFLVFVGVFVLLTLPLRRAIRQRQINDRESLGLQKETNELLRQVLAKLDKKA